MSIVPGLVERYEQRIQALNEGVRLLEKRGAEVLAKRQTKQCSRCQHHKPLAAFSKHPKSKDGRQWWCRHCYAKYQANRLAEKKRDIKEHEDMVYPFGQSQDERATIKGIAVGVMVGLSIWLIIIALVLAVIL